MTRRIGLLLSGAFLALISFATVASAQTATQYPVESGTLAVNRTEARPGEPITITGTGCPGSGTVTITFDNQAAGTTTTRADGTFSATVTVPANATPGSHTITATCVLANGATRRQTATVNVLGAATQAGTLPRTGSGLTTSLAASAALLIAAGSVAVVATRRRRTA